MFINTSATGITDACQQYNMNYAITINKKRKNWVYVLNIFGAVVDAMNMS